MKRLPRLIFGVLNLEVVMPGKYFHNLDFKCLFSQKPLIPPDARTFFPGECGHFSILLRCPRSLEQKVGGYSGGMEVVRGYFRLGRATDSRVCKG